MNRTVSDHTEEVHHVVEAVPALFVLSIPLALGLYVLAGLAVAAKAEGQKGKPAPQRAGAAMKPVKVAMCYDCHTEI